MNRDEVRCYRWRRRFFRGHPCVDCGERSYKKLEFDHVRGTKWGTVATLLWLHYPLEVVDHEAGKCQVRCRACHAKRHGLQRKGDR